MHFVAYAIANWGRIFSLKSRLGGQWWLENHNHNIKTPQWLWRPFWETPKSVIHVVDKTLPYLILPSWFRPSSAFFYPAALAFFQSLKPAMSLELPTCSFPCPEVFLPWLFTIWINPTHPLGLGRCSCPVEGGGIAHPNPSLFPVSTHVVLLWEKLLCSFSH